MMNSFIPQKNHSGSPQPIFLSQTAKTYAGVVQDKSASRSERSALDQPERVTMYERADKPKSAGTRSQKQHAHSNSFVPLTIHVPCIVRDEIERRAKNTGGKKPLSLSEVGRPIFTRGLQADVDMQYGALLEPIIRRAIKREMRSLRSFLMLILSRIAF